LIHPHKSADTDESSREYRKYLGAVKTELKRASAVLESGALEEFLLLTDSASVHRRKMITETLLELAQELGDHYKKLAATKEAQPSTGHD
jgi:hypothetical protein